LNLPRKDGCEVLSNIKADPALAKLPVVIFITSQANSDIAQSYTLGSEPLFKKAGESSGIRRSGPSVAEFWLGFASLPQKEKR
jgi:CheY-like chemotaxis protein